MKAGEGLGVVGLIGAVLCIEAVAFLGWDYLFNDGRGQLVLPFIWAMTILAFAGLTDEVCGDKGVTGWLRFALFVTAFFLLGFGLWRSYTLGW